MSDNKPDSSRQEIITPQGRRLACCVTPGETPGVMFFGGFLSDVTGSKAQALAAHCRQQGRAFVRFDYSGHGASGGRFEDGTLGQWRDDALAVLDQVTTGPQVLVGSSMGGWLMVLAALARPHRVAGLLGIAAAPDFTETLLRPGLSDAQRQALETQGSVAITGEEGGLSFTLTRALLDESRDHLVLGGGMIPISCPVRLVQGQRDGSVPWATALTLAERLMAEDVVVTLIKDGDHRLSRPADLNRLARVLDGLLVRVTEGASASPC